MVHNENFELRLGGDKNISCIWFFLEGVWKFKLKPYFYE